MAAEADEARLAVAHVAARQAEQALRIHQPVIVLLLVAVMEKDHVDIIGLQAAQEVVKVAVADGHIARLGVLAVLDASAEVGRDERLLPAAAEAGPHHVAEGGLGVEHVHIVDAAVQGGVDDGAGVGAGLVEQVLGAEADGADLLVRAAEAAELHGDSSFRGQEAAVAMVAGIIAARWPAVKIPCGDRTGRLREAPQDLRDNGPATPPGY